MLELSTQYFGMLMTKAATAVIMAAVLPKVLVQLNRLDELYIILNGLWRLNFK